MKKGFSFLELLIVIGIIGILFYISLISFASKPDLKLQLQNHTNQFVEDLRFVRQRAILSHKGMDLTLDPFSLSYTFLNEKGNMIERKFPENFLINSTATLFSFDRDGYFTADSTETYATLTLTIDVYSSTIKINFLGFIERYGP